MIKNINPVETVILSVKFLPALKSIAEYLKLIESLDSKVNRLINAPLDAALESIERAKYSTGKNKEKELRDAIREFKRIIRSENKSINNVYRLFVVYYGYAMCRYQLNDLENAKLIFNEYAKIDLKDATVIEEKNITKVKVSLSKQIIVQGWGVLLAFFLCSLALVIGIAIPIFAVPFGIYGICYFRSNKDRKTFVHKISDKLDKLLPSPFDLEQRRLFLLSSKKEAADFAQEIERDTIELNYFKKMFKKLFNKKESKLLKKQWQYFNNVCFKLKSDRNTL